MKNRVRYRFEYLIKSLFIFREGFRLQDKVLLIPYGLFRVLGLVLIAIYNKVHGPSRSGNIEKLTFPFFDVLLKNRYGLFFCRRKTNDIWICQEAYEFDETEIMRTIKNGLFIDIGANVGRYTIMVGRQMAGSGNVIAIEPEPGNYETLIRNIKLNKLTNVQALNLAAYSSDNDFRLFMDPYSTGGHSIVTHCSEQTITIHARRLDDILHDLGYKDVNLIKIDVEGATPGVLIGAEQTITSNNHLRILFEHYNDAHFEECREILESRNFTIAQLTSWGYNFIATRETT